MKKKKKKCWPWAHVFMRHFGMEDILNDGAFYTRGSKVYVCEDCSKVRVVWPSGVF